MLHLLKPKPGEKEEKENVFRGIRELPWWHITLEVVGYVAALLVVGEFLLRWL